MPSIDKHVEISIARTGKPYREVHQWIDNPETKAERHDLTKVLEVSKMFEEKYGPEAAREYVQHLADDLNGKFGHLVEDVEKMVNNYLDYFGVLPKGK